MTSFDRWMEIAEELGSYDLGVAFQTQPDMVRAKRLGGPAGIYRPGEYVETEPACQRIAEMERQRAELLEALRALVPSDEQEAGWWCLHCVAETEATNDERCVNCGEPFGDPNEEAEAIRVARAAIAKAEGNQ